MRTLITAVVFWITGWAALAAAGIPPAPADPRDVAGLTRETERRLAALRDAPDGPARLTAARELWDQLENRGRGTVPVADVIPLVVKVLAESRDADARAWAVRTLQTLDDVRTLPHLVRALDDRAGGVRDDACSGLGRLGPRAAEAGPALAKSIEAGRTSTEEGVRALAAVQGPASVPLLTRLIGGGRLDKSTARAAVYAVAALGDPTDAAVAALMEQALYNDADQRGAAVAFFCRAEGAAARRHLRWCLTLPPGDPRNPRDAPEPLDGLLRVANFGPAGLRARAAEYLGERRDEPAFDAIAALALKDEYFSVRAAAATALGRYGGVRVVEPLTAVLATEDTGQSAAGHTGGTLARVAVEALVKIATAGGDGAEPALDALYEGSRLPKSAGAECRNFWRAKGDFDRLRPFLARYEKAPLDPVVAAGVLDDLLRARAKPLTGDAAAAAQRDFLAGGPDLVGAAVGRPAPEVRVLRTEFTFYEGGFADVLVAWPRAGSAVLWHKAGDRWVPLGTTMGWVE